MRDFEITWIRDHEIKDLGLKKKAGDLAYISEAEAKQSVDYKEARRVGAIEVRPFLRRVVKIPSQSSVNNASKEGLSMIQVEALEAAIIKAVAPIIQEQRRVNAQMEQLLSLVKDLVANPLVIERGQKQMESSRTRVSIEDDLPVLDYIPDIRFHDTSFQNEVQTETASNKSVQDTLSKLKKFRKERQEKGKED